MTKLASLIVAASFALTASAAASAADGAVTLRVDRGNVMTSEGGEFVSAQSGKLLVAGERLMVSEGSVATVVYDNDCTREYNTPGVYAVEQGCAKGALVAGTTTSATAKGVDLVGAAGIAAGVGVGAALLSSMDQSDARPPAPVAPAPAPAPVPPVSR